MKRQWQTHKMYTTNNGKFIFHFVCDLNVDLFQSHRTKTKATVQKIQPSLAETT